MPRGTSARQREPPRTCQASSPPATSRTLSNVRQSQPPAQAVWPPSTPNVSWNCIITVHEGIEDAQNGRPTRPQARQIPEAYPQGYVEDFVEPRTKLAAIFSILLTPCAAPSSTTTNSPSKAATGNISRSGSYAI